MMMPNQFSTQEVLDLACEIQSIPAPTFEESRRTEYIFNQFRYLGLANVQIDNVGNVLARLPGGSALPLVISAHLDTVFPMGHPLTLKSSPGYLFGASIGDNSLGLAGMLFLGKSLQAASTKLPGDVWLAATVGEEGLGNLRGMQAILQKFGANITSYLILEGIGLGKIYHRGLGVERYKIHVETPGGHSWGKFGQPSAIHELAKIIVQFNSLYFPQKPRTTLNVGTIVGGTTVNTIAADAILELDLRSEEQTALDALVQQVHQIVEKSIRPDVHLTIEKIGSRPAGGIPVDHPLVLLAQGILQELGIPAIPGIASTDANLPLSQGYPAICIGLTDGDGAHTAGEYIKTQPVGVGMAQLMALTQRIWGI
jgi:tripeptide aminopeptidase